jgi:glycosyltransferase involved in cell wall biosynthesis
MRIIVADVLVPFVRGGAERHVDALVDQLRRQGYEVEKVLLPFNPQAKADLLAQAAAWRLLDVSSSLGRPIDLVIATRFPSYFVRHRRKVAWVIHQHRAAYELCGTPYSDFDHTEADVGLRGRLLELDTRVLRECRRVFANARNTASRLRRYNGIDAEALYHPPPLAGRLSAGPYGDYVLVVGRLERVKRVDLAIRALAETPAPTRLVIVGEGSERAALDQLAREVGGGRVEFAGSPGPDDLARLYAGARAVLYAPFDEDYGYVTLEAFLSAKPVITAADSGGTLEFVTDGETGLVAPPDAAALAAAMTRVARDDALAARLGRAGLARASAITWDGVVERLLA